MGKGEQEVVVNLTFFALMKQNGFSSFFVLFDGDGNVNRLMKMIDIGIYCLGQHYMHIILNTCVIPNIFNILLH